MKALPSHRLGINVMLLLVAWISTGWCVAKSQPPSEGVAWVVAQWTRFQAEFTSSRVYENPVQDVQMEIEFTSPSGKKSTVLGFWDGDRKWKVRFSPDEAGKWTYRTRTSPKRDPGLDAQNGAFRCVPYKGKNPLYRHGAVGVSQNRRYFVHADGTPFFWMGDTAWLGPLKSSAADWETYLQDRLSKGFSVIHIFTTQARHVPGDAEGRLAYIGKRERIGIDPAFYQRLDKRMDAVNDWGLAVAPILIHDSIVVPPSASALEIERADQFGKKWFLPTLLPEDQLIVLGRYMVARYGAHQVLWTLGGDGDYRGERAEMWKRIGRAVFKYSHDRIATMHPGGVQWDADEFRQEPWFNFISYQSGHGNSERELRWLTQGPPSQDWKIEPYHPEINNELNYEGFIPYGSREGIPFDAHAVRRACYWSLLVAPPSGVTYGAHGIWYWAVKPELPMQAEAWGVTPPWHEAMRLPGSTSMKHLREFFLSIDYWKLLPDPELVAEQPGKDSPNRFIAAARSEEGNVAVVYIPEGGTVSLNMSRLKSPVQAEWFDPATGWRMAGGEIANEGVHQFEIKGLWDSVLLLKTIEK
jgi:hypothetical protein